MYYKYLMKRGALVYLGSPNNPVGECWPSDIVESLALQFPKSFFLIDETYTEEAASYVHNTPNSYSIVQSTVKLSNVFVYRTFSTIFGLAALQIEYGVGHSDILKRLCNIVNTKTFWPCVENAALAALQHVNYYFKLAIFTAKLNSSVQIELESKNWNVISGKGHFLLIFCGANQSSTIFQMLKSKNIYVQDCGKYSCLDGYIRISTGTALDMEEVINALGEASVERPIQYYYTPKSHIAKLKTLLRKTLKIVKIPIWLEAETLLGCVRHNGIIPTDNNITLGYYFGKKESLKSADFNKVGLTIRQNSTNNYWQVGTPDMHITIIPYIYINNAYVCVNANYRNTKYYHGELFPLKTSRFYDLDVSIPHQSLKVLERSLGPDFMYTTRLCVNRKVLEFSIYDYTPA
jgi:hypothetical protein